MHPVRGGPNASDSSNIKQCQHQNSVAIKLVEMDAHERGEGQTAGIEGGRGRVRAGMRGLPDGLRWRDLSNGRATRQGAPSASGARTTGAVRGGEARNDGGSRSPLGAIYCGERARPDKETGAGSFDDS